MCSHFELCERKIYITVRKRREWANFQKVRREKMYCKKYGRKLELGGFVHAKRNTENKNGIKQHQLDELKSAAEGGNYVLYKLQRKIR